MIIFLNEDRSYRNWVIHNRLGFVLDGHRKPKTSHLMLHRADCAEVKVAATKRHHWTTGNHFKACSLDWAELETWATENSSKPAEYCPVCRPVEERAAEPAHLTKLGRDILDYVLEAATIHMEHEFPAYHLTVGDIAACFAKTVGQLGPVLKSLVEQDMIVFAGTTKKQSTISARRIVSPTITALRTLEFFRDEPEAILEQELAKLRVE